MAVCSDRTQFTQLFSMRYNTRTVQHSYVVARNQTSLPGAHCRVLQLPDLPFLTSIIQRPPGLNTHFELWS